MRNLFFIIILVIDRKKYRELGWNVAYEFNDSDLEVAIQQLQSFLDFKDNTTVEGASVPWNALCDVTADIIFGGRYFFIVHVRT